MHSLMAPISIGDLIDRITILELKVSHLSDQRKDNAKKEVSQLLSILNKYELRIEDADINKLRDINMKLWNIEDEIREKESEGDFGNDFIQLARSVYFSNDKRSAIKKSINIKYKSNIIEEKAYRPY